MTCMALITNEPAELPSDITPGIVPPMSDRALILTEIERLQKKLDTLKPFVVRVGQLFCLYQDKKVRVQTLDAQLMWDYLGHNFPAGTTIQWFVLPAVPPLQAS